MIGERETSTLGKHRNLPVMEAIVGACCHVCNSLQGFQTPSEPILDESIPSMQYLGREMVTTELRAPIQ